MFEVLGGPEGAGEDRLSVEEVVVIVGHANATVVGAAHPMSIFFLLSIRPLTSFYVCMALPGFCYLSIYGINVYVKYV